MIIPVMLIVALILFLIWLLSKPSEAEEPDTSDHCKSCRYRCRNCTQAPCIVCDNGDEWVQSELIDQEDFD